MKTYSYDEMGYNEVFGWGRSVFRQWGYWWVHGRSNQFTHEGYAVMDDYGTLREVPAP